VEGLIAFGTALGLIALLEIGDKTQLVTISLATRHPWAKVLAGAAVGLTSATAIGAAIGGALAATLSAWLTILKLGGGVLFIVLGVWTVVQAIRRHRRSEEVPTIAGSRGAFAETAGFLFLAEFGDKTQIAVIILAATYAAPVSVFAGASLAETLIAVTSIVIGAWLSKILTKQWVEMLSTGLFVIAGVLLILEAFSVF
jgi:Ca2+/H+ antiporter, TMEM165/GDT1 family